jgi:hypothetical protein
LGPLPTTRSMPWMPIKALPFSMSMGNPRFVEELFFAVFSCYSSSQRQCWFLATYRIFVESFIHTFCLLCLGVGSSRRLWALQPGDSGQAGDSGGKYPETPAVGKTSGLSGNSAQSLRLSRPETPVPNPGDSGVDDNFPPRFHLLLMFSSPGHVCLSPMLSYPLFHRWF